MHVILFLTLEMYRKTLNSSWVPVIPGSFQSKEAQDYFSSSLHPRLFPDVGIIRSIIPDDFTWGDGENCSWFIRTICEEFTENVHEGWADLVTLVTLVLQAGAGLHQQNLIKCLSFEMQLGKQFHFFAGCNEFMV